MSFRPLAQESVTGPGLRLRLAALSSVLNGRLLAAGSVAVAAVLLVLYDRLSTTSALTADSANAVLQGEAMAGGNILLHGWTLSGASFFVTDLPFYALVAAVRGLSPAVAHDVGAIIYTLLVLVACFLARGPATGARGLGRMAITLVLLVAPAPGNAVTLLLQGPFHAGTTLVLLVALLVLDTWGEAVLGAAVFGLLLALAVLSDALALYVGVVPVLIVCCLRLIQPRRDRRPDVALLAATALSVPASMLLAGLLVALGGFATVPLHGSFAQVQDMPKNLELTVQGALLLFGADFFGRPLATLGTLSIFVHLVGFVLVLVTVRWAVAAWRRGQEPDRLTQVLLVAMAVDVAAYLFSNQAIDLMTSRYLIPLLAFGAVLAGRVGGDRIWQGRLARAGAVVSVAYLGFLATSLGTPEAVSPDGQVGAFLERHHLTYGVAAYWQASTVTVETGGRVRVRAVDLAAATPSPYWWEAQGSWYDPSVPGNNATFVLRDASDSRSLDQASIEAAFGPPVQQYRFGQYEVLVWDRNLLRDLTL